jgi:hypothetical protein
MLQQQTKNELFCKLKTGLQEEHIYFLNTSEVGPGSHRMKYRPLIQRAVRSVPIRSVCIFSAYKLDEGFTSVWESEVYQFVLKHSIVYCIISNLTESLSMSIEVYQAHPVVQSPC